VILVDHNYYIIELNIYPTKEVFNWLNKNLGSSSSGRWFYRQKKLYFANSQDHLMFLLFWGDK